MPAKYALCLLGLVAATVVIIATATGCNEELLAKDTVWAQPGDLMVSVPGSDADRTDKLRGPSGVLHSNAGFCNPCSQACIDRTSVCGEYHD